MVISAELKKPCIPNQSYKKPRDVFGIPLLYYTSFFILKNP